MDLFSQSSGARRNASTSIGTIRSVSSLESHCEVHYSARTVGNVGRRGTTSEAVPEFAAFESQEFAPVP